MGLLEEFAGRAHRLENAASEPAETCLRRIRETDERVQAWVCTAAPRAVSDGPLRGIPFGVKDVFDTADFPTALGSPLFAGRKTPRDAALVAMLVSRGAVVLGKTHTAAFAYFDPPPTRNPHNAEHTPGGSSSGSAAAVAAGQVPFALGTQTQGSVLRPAAFCGIAGFKPTHGLLPMDGVLPFAPSLDTAGVFTQTAAGMRLLWERMGFPVGADSAVRFGVPKPLSLMEPEMQTAFERSVDLLRRAGLALEAFEMPVDFDSLLAATRFVNDYEGAHTHEQLWREYGSRIGAKLAGMIERGLGLPAAGYTAELGVIAEAKRKMADVFANTPVVLTPAAPGPAPRGLASTGDPRLNAPWTALGVPAISIPMPVGQSLPLGLQLTAAWGDEALLLDAAARIEKVFAAPPR